MEIDGANTTTPRWVTARAERAHAMKNVLSTIRLAGRLVRREVSQAARAQLDMIDENVFKLVALIDEELCVRDEEDDHVQDVSRAVDVPSLFETTRLRLVDRAARANVELAFDCAPATVQGVEDDLAVAIHNLVANAIDATPPNGIVTVRTRCAPSGEHAWEIRETGSCMPHEVLAHVRAQRWRRNKELGTGRLAIAAAVIGAHGGLLQVAAHHGGCFRVWLPTAKVA